MTNTYQIQAEDMIKRRGIERALADARRFAETKDRKSQQFWKRVIVWIETRNTERNAGNVVTD
jgi:hypothetical protein